MNIAAYYLERYTFATSIHNIHRRGVGFESLQVAHRGFLVAVKAVIEHYVARAVGLL